MPKRAVLGIIIIAVFLMTGLLLVTGQAQTTMFNITGEEDFLPQLSGTGQFLLTRIQPPLQTADQTPVQHTGLNPYGINTFLQNEVEIAKQEKALRLISEAGIKWIRQEFPWEDIEIHGKDDFEDRRTDPHKSAWQKYDTIVDLAEVHDIQIMARLSNPPAWTRALTDTVGSFAPPDRMADYGDYVEAVARRYRGRIPAYQIWNEPNIYPEWGEYPVNAEEYTALLKEGYLRVKEADPEAIVVMGALAATIELDRSRRYDANGWPVSPGGLSDVLFLQQMYDAGAASYFDVLAMQGYGLWSGPTDRRMQPRVLNFSRPLYIRDVMVRNGDAHKPIWLSELSWNAVPPESGLPPVYGQVTLEQQGRYAALAFERLQREWPWLGVGFYWFFKQADDRERDSNPQYYFRMVEPDFSPMPVYDAIKEQANRPAVMYPGRHQAEHWAVGYHGDWDLLWFEADALRMPRRLGQAGDTVRFNFEGSSLAIVTSADSAGRLQVQIDGDKPVEIELAGESVPDQESKSERRILLAQRLSQEQHSATIEILQGPMSIDGFVVNSRPSLSFNRAGSLIMVVAALGGGWALWRYRRER